MTGTASLVSGSPSVIANRTRFSINTAPLSTSNVTVYTSFLPQATVGAAAVNGKFLLFVECLLGQTM